MKCNFPIELNGITNIVINDVLFMRDSTKKFWLNTVTKKVVIDAHMWQRVKRMMHKERIISEKIYAPIAGKYSKVANFVPCYRAWANTDSLNIEKIYYD